MENQDATPQTPREAVRYFSDPDTCLNVEVLKSIIGRRLTLKKLTGANILDVSSEGKDNAQIDRRFGLDGAI